MLSPQTMMDASQRKASRMHPLKNRTTEFPSGPAQEAARVRAAMSVMQLCREDLDMALAGGPDERRRLANKLVVRLRRERQKGLRGHWSYDLNRHISLRQALNLLLHNQD
jgi:hypothetical protein